MKIHNRPIVTKSIWLTRDTWKKISDMKFELGLRTMGDVIEYLLRGEKNATKRGSAKN